VVIFLSMRYLALLFFLFLTSACGEFAPRLEPGDLVALDPDFSDAVTENLIAGCREWNEALPLLQIQCQTSAIGDWHVEKSSAIRGIGWTSYGSPLIRIDSDLILSVLGHVSYTKHTMMHELGHALGFHDHLEDDEALLDNVAPSVMCVDAKSLAVILEIRPELSEGARPTCK
jgi:hypothetical protein